MSFLSETAKRWTRADEALLRDLWATDLHSREIARRLGRTYKSIQARAMFLGLPLRGSLGTHSRFTPGETERLVELLKTTKLSYSEIAAALGTGRSTNSVRHKARELRLHHREVESPHVTLAHRVMIDSSKAGATIKREMEAVVGALSSAGPEPWRRITAAGGFPAILYHNGKPVFRDGKVVWVWPARQEAVAA